jgi:hypothetical protein
MSMPSTSRRPSVLTATAMVRIPEQVGHLFRNEVGR